MGDSTDPGRSLAILAPARRPHPLLLARLELAGALVTIDAIGAQSAIAATIRARGGDYLLALKVNRPATLEDVAAFFADPPPGALDTFETTDGESMAGSRCAATPYATTSAGCPPTAATPARSPSPTSP